MSADIRVMSWDYNQQPDMDALAKAVSELSGGTVQIVQVETHSSDYAIAIGPAGMTEQDAENAYDLWEAGER